MDCLRISACENSGNDTDSSLAHEGTWVYIDSALFPLHLFGMNQHIFCFGHGYSCDYLAHALHLQGGWRVSGTTRDEEKKIRMAENGVTPYLFDSLTPLPDLLHTMRDVTHLLISTPPDDQGDPAFLTHAPEIVHLPNLQWVGYLSTTGVYGDRDGAEVDESAELRPSSKRGSRRVKAEEQWLSLFHSAQLPVHIFRLAGIYGPGRSALDSVRAGVARRINKPGHAFGRIHVEDIVHVLTASMRNPQPGQIYNVCDDEPAPSHKVIEYASELLERPAPPLVNFDEADLAPITRSFYMDNRRTKNTKIKDQLGVQLKYPNYRKGLEGCLAAEDHALKIFRLT